jgi:hypothetical protein
MFQVTIEDLILREALQNYKRLTGKAIKDVLIEQAKLLAQRLMKLTFPYSKAQGNKRVQIDIGRVYLRNQWFEETFTFKNQRMQDRVKNLVLAKNVADLEIIFNNSPKLRQLHIEPFDPARHAAARRNGRVNYPRPWSFPLTEQNKVNQYITAKTKQVGYAKSGWAKCVSLLGGSIPGWLNKDAGAIVNESDAAEKPYITLINTVDYFEKLDSKGNIVNRALEGRAIDMIKAAESALKRAAAQAKLD